MSINKDFYKFAMDLFITTGHAGSSVPVSINHSANQVIYFDTNKTLLIDNTQKRALEHAENISHLFDLNDDIFATRIGANVSYYSIVIDCEMKSRSQTAFETHMLLYPAFEASMSIILFKHCDALLVSIMYPGAGLFLSDWYNVDMDYNNLIDHLHIANLSISSAREFILDLIYCLARAYYFRSVIDSNSLYSLLPDKFFIKPDLLEITTVDNETINETIRDILSAAKKEYGDDYIEPEYFSVEAIEGDTIEFELLSLELEPEEVIISDEMIPNEENEFVNDFDDVNSEEKTVKDIYELDDVDPEVFKDAIQLLKWLKKKEIPI